MPRSSKDEVPEFENPADALAWMEAKLNGSWCDSITEEPKTPKVLAEEERKRLLAKEDMNMEDFMLLMGNSTGESS